MTRPPRRQAQLLGAFTAILLAVGVLAAVFGPYPEFLLHRVLPFESGPAGAVGYRYEVDDTDLGMSEMLCVGDTPTTGCDYIVQLRAPGPDAPGRSSESTYDPRTLNVDEPMLLLLRMHRGEHFPGIQYPEVVDAAAVPAELAHATMLRTDRRDVVALGRTRDADGWYPALAAWRVDTDHWRLSRVATEGLEGEDPGRPATGRLPPRPELYVAMAWHSVTDPPDITRPDFGSASIGHGESGFGITYLHDLTEGVDVLVVLSRREFAHTDIEALPHEGDLALIHGLVADGALRGDLIGLLDLDERGAAGSVNRAWRVTTEGELVALPLDGISCRPNAAAEPLPNPPCALSNREALRDLEAEAR